MEINKILDEDIYKTFKIVLPSSFIEEKINELAKNKQPTYKLDGFREGKVPVEEIVKREGNLILYDVVDFSLEECVSKIVKDGALKLASRPNVDFENNKFERGSDIVVNLSIEIIPDIKDVDFDKLKITKYKLVISDKDTEDSVVKILNNYRDLEKKDGSSVIGDVVSINFDGFINGEAFNGGKGEDFKLQLGSNTFINGFEEQLLDKRSGDLVDVNVTFPSDYYNSNLAGKDALFKVEVLDVLSYKNTEVNDEFVQKKLGVESIDKLKEAIKKELEDNYSYILFGKEKLELTDKINDIFDFEVPKKAVEERLEYYKNTNIDGFDQEKAKNDIIRTLRLSYVLSSIAEKNNITISDSEMTEFIMKQSTYYPGKEKEYIDTVSSNVKLQESIKATLFEDKVFKFVLDKIPSDDVKEVSLEDIAKI